MKKVKLVSPAKINLTLDVLGVNKEGFHELSSLVASINLYDYITIKKRVDSSYTLKCKGIDPKCSMVDNNAYKSAKLFSTTFNTLGVDIAIDKHIPVGAGLGGSSADTAGVLNGMKKLFGIQESVKPLADSLGSDTSYMLKGGYAVLMGRGEKQEFLQLDFPLYLIIVPCEDGVSAKQCYQKFDALNKTFSPCTDKAVNSIKNKDFLGFCEVAKNDLYHSSNSLVPQIGENLNALKDAGAPLALMTGSGSAVVGVFEKRKDRDKAYKKLKTLYGKSLIKANTI